MTQDKINEILKPDSETTKESLNEQIQKIKNLELQLGIILKELRQDKNTDNYEQVGEGTSQIDELFRQKFSGIKNIDELKKGIENKSEILNFLTTVFDEGEKVIGEINKKNNWEKTKNNLNGDILKTWKIINEFMPDNYQNSEKGILIIEKIQSINNKEETKKLNNFLELFKKPEKNKEKIQEIYFKNFIGTGLGDLILDLGFLKINTILKDSNKKVEENGNKIFNLFSKLIKEDELNGFMDDAKYLACKIPEKNLSSLLSTFEVIFDGGKSFEVDDFVNYIKEEGEIKYAIDIMDTLDYYFNENDYKKNEKLKLLKEVNKRLQKDYKENLLLTDISGLEKDGLYEKIYGNDKKISKEKFYKKLDKILDNYTNEGKIVNYSELRDELNEILPEKNHIEKPSDLYNLLGKRQRQIVEYNEKELLSTLNLYIDYNKINSLDNVIKNKLNIELDEYKITKKPEKILSILIDNGIIPAANFQDNGESIIKTLISKQILISLDFKKNISTNIENKKTEGIDQSTPEGKKEALKKINESPQEIIDISEKTYNKVKEKGLIGFGEGYGEILGQISDEVISKSIDKDGNINTEIFDKNLNKYFGDNIKLQASENGKIDINKIPQLAQFSNEKGLELKKIENKNEVIVELNGMKNEIKSPTPEKIIQTIETMKFFEKFGIKELYIHKNIISEQVTNKNGENIFNFEDGINENESQKLLFTISKSIFEEKEIPQDKDGLEKFYIKKQNEIGKNGIFNLIKEKFKGGQPFKLDNFINTLKQNIS